MKLVALGYQAGIFAVTNDVIETIGGRWRPSSRSTARPLSETDAAFRLMRPNEPEDGEAAMILNRDGEPSGGEASGSGRNGFEASTL